MENKILKIINKLSAKIDNDLKCGKSEEETLKEMDEYFQELTILNKEFKKKYNIK